MWSKAATGRRSRLQRGELTAAPGVQVLAENVRGREVEPVEPAVDRDPVAHLAAPALDRLILQPSRILDGTVVALELQEHHPAGEIHQWVRHQRVRTEVADTGDRGLPVEVHTDIRVRRAEVAVNDGGPAVPLGKGSEKLSPDLADPGYVRLQPGPAESDLWLQLGIEQLGQRSELL